MSRRKKSAQTTAESDEHFVKMAEWIGLESKAEIARMAERRKIRDPKAAEKSGDTLIDLAIVENRHGLGGRHLVTFAKRNRELQLPWHRLKVGTPVVLSTFPEDSGQTLQGVVSRRKASDIQVAFDHYPDGKVFRLDLTADEVTRQRQMAAIAMVKDSGGRLGYLRRITMGDVEPEFNSPEDLHWQTELNESQKEAVQFALSAHDVAIIHGPPGTGKTTTVIELIIQAVQKGQKVLACAPSNTAVDNLLEKLVKHNQKVVRIGHPARVSETLRSNTLDALVEESEEMAIVKAMLREAEQIYRKLDRYTRAKPERGARREMHGEAKRLKSDARLLERQTVENILDRANIICATTTFNEDLIGERWFDLCVVDEACQSTEPGCWIPLTRCDRFVLAGDHQQLPPTIISREAAQAGFKVSLMERIHDEFDDQVTRLLTTQYRMHDKIMQHSSVEFYDNQLVSHPSVSQHVLADLEHVSDSNLTQTPLTFIDTAGAGWDEELEPDGESKRNPKEAEFILQKVKELINAGLHPRDIAVIAPYAAQVRLLRRSNEYPDLEIDTVDGFQGREKEAVLISLVRSNDSGEIGFLSDQRRMNVAMTRARRKLLVVGDSATIGANAFFKRVLEYFESQSAYKSVWEETDWSQ